MSRELIFDDTQNAIRDCTKKFRGRPKYCAENSYYCIEMASKIYEIDVGMSALRCITAEEEAVSCLFSTLRSKKYPNHDVIKPNHHWQKALLYPFILSVSEKLKIFEQFGAELLIILKDDIPKIQVRLITSKVLNANTPINFHYMLLEQPFDIVAMSQGKPLSFEDNLNEYAAARGKKDIIEFAHHKANLRNRILYSTDTKSPRISMDFDFIENTLKRVTVIHGITVAINQQIGILPFVSQLMDEFALLINKNTDRKFSWNTDDFSADIEIIKNESSHTTKIKRDGFTLYNTSYIPYSFTEPKSIMENPCLVTDKYYQHSLNSSPSTPGTGPWRWCRSG